MQQDPNLFSNTLNPITDFSLDQLTQSDFIDSSIQSTALLDTIIQPTLDTLLNTTTVTTLELAQMAAAATASSSNTMDLSMGVSTPGAPAIASAPTPSTNTLVIPPTAQRRKLSGRYVLADFTIERTLGTGSFGRVHLARSRHNMRFYAIKVSSTPLSTTTLTLTK